MSMDLFLEAWVSSLIELTRFQWMLGAGRRWTPGEKLKLLFTGYNGTRNTGSDIRVEEMLRQVRHILGPDRVELSVLTQNFDLTSGYFAGVRQVKLPDVFPPFLYREVRNYDGVVACEGSMFKSKFANALTTMMIGSLGIASAQNKLSLGYGAEAGYMDPLLARMCSRYCKDSLVITRNEESALELGELGVATELGTDTAWTFEPYSPEYGSNALREAGWDGETPVLIICPINPFWWPVKASLAKSAFHAVAGAYKESHYRSIYFHTWGPKVVQAYNRYLTALANAVSRFRSDHRIFPAVVGMEQLDTDACHRLSSLLGGVSVFTSDRYNMYELVSILRRGHMMISSRYHGIVTAMPALVPSAGITMDERIRNLMRERGHDDLLLTVDEPDLEDKLVVVLEKLDSDREPIRAGMGRAVACNLKVMARMGVYLEQHVQRTYPDFEIRNGVYSWEDYLPPLSPELKHLVETYESSRQ